MTWARGMAAAYEAGLEDGRRGRRYVDQTRGGGFDACYWQGVGHGLGECLCPDRLTVRGGDRGRCACCGNYRDRTNPNKRPRAQGE